jgi:hypothetical protein
VLGLESGAGAGLADGDAAGAVELESGCDATPLGLGASSGTAVTAEDGAAVATGMAEASCTGAGSRIFWPAEIV